MQQPDVTFIISLNCISNNQTPDSPLQNSDQQISLNVRIALHVTQ